MEGTVTSAATWLASLRYDSLLLSTREWLTCLVPPHTNLDAFTEMQWVTVNHEPGSYPF